MPRAIMTMVRQAFRRVANLRRAGSSLASARATLLIFVEASRRGSMSAQNRRDEPGGG
jgi:hypothetical protein